MKPRYIDAVSSHNLMKVRIMLADELLLDPRGETFTEMLEHAKNNLTDLFESNEAANYTFSPDESTWDIELASRIKQDLISNFSIEKLALFEKVARKIGEDKAKALAEEESRERYRSEGVSTQRRTSYDDDSSGSGNRSNPRMNGNENPGRKERKPAMDKRTMGTISLCGGAALTIVGVCVGGVAQTLLCLVGGSAVVVGGIVLLNENKK